MTPNFLYPNFYKIIFTYRSNIFIFGQSFTLSPEKITWRTSGGIVDLFFIITKDVHTLYNELRKLLGFFPKSDDRNFDKRPPRWTLGKIKITVFF